MSALRIAASSTDAEYLPNIRARTTGHKVPAESVFKVICHRELEGVSAP